jgi:phosphatidate cytidylyltransferase
LHAGIQESCRPHGWRTVPAMTGTRILTAAVLIPVVVAAVLWAGPWVVAGIVALVVVLGLNEFFRLSEQAGLPGHPRWTTVCALLLIGLQLLEAAHRGVWVHSDFGLLYSPDHSPLPAEAALVVFLLGAAFLVVTGRAPMKDRLSQLGIDCAAVLLIALPLSFLVRLHGAQPHGPQMVLFLLVLLWIGDSAAYFAGRAFGRHKMAPEISPGKTWEGAVANLLGSLVVGYLAARWITLPVVHLVAMAGLANIAGQLGDLTESAYKRSAGAKDSGSLLPGHGGILDRVDSLIFAAPVVWYYFHVILLGLV